MVPYIFSTVPGGTSIPLSELDSNFAYLATSPAFAGNVTIGGTLGVTGASTFTGLVTMNGGLTLNGPFTINGTTVSPTGTTGTGNLVFSNTPTLITPILGTPTSGDLSNCTNYQVNQLAGVGAGIINFLINPTTANLAIAVVDETGTGNLVLSNNPVLTSPTLVTAILGTPASGNLANCTGVTLTGGAGVTGILPIAFGGTGLNTVGPVGSVLTSDGTGLQYVAAAPAASISGGAPSQILYQSAVNTTSFIPNGVAGQSLLSAGAGTPTWGLIDLTVNITGILPVANGGTGGATPFAALTNLLPPQTLNTNKFLQTNGVSTLWTSAVTSVTYTGDNVIYQTGPTVPVTSSGTLAPTLLNQSATTFFAGPSTGAATTPSFRQITYADLAPAFVGARSANTNGYQILPGGIIMQWGIVQLNGGTPVGGSYPIAFTSAVWVMTGGVQNQSNMAFELLPLSLTNFQAQGSTGGTPQLQWIAIGI